MEPKNSHPLFGNRVTVFLASVVWTVVVVVSLWSQRGQLDHTAGAMAKIDAITNLKKDMAIRQWASSVGGVFVNADKAPKLETLEEQERLVGVKANGEPFKLVTLTPIHILEAVQQVSNKEYGIKERLTSQQLRNRNNAPDDWEEKALKALQGGAEMATEATTKKGSHGLMRVMIPMRMEDECIECHRDTLVPVGGLRGGATISVDLNTYRTAQEPAWRSIQYWHLSIWLLGLTAISTFGYFARRHAREQDRQSEERRENELAFSAMAEGAVITDADGTILWVNDAFCTIYGYAPEEVIGKNPRILKSGRHDAAVYANLWQQLKSVGRWRGELWNKRKSGEIFPEEISIQALRGHDGRIRRYISIFSDITERKEAEEKLKESWRQLQELTEFLQTVREEERTRIAREIHDELGQTLTALRIDLAWLRAQCGSDDPRVADKLASGFQLVVKTLDSVRRISEDLRPGMLDTLGLAAAIQHHAAKFTEHTGIPCRLSMNREEFEVGDKVATAVFRIVQEALTNVARHAGARSVTVEVREVDDAIEVAVQDDGCGFGPAPAGAKKTFGLLGMQERVKMLGGRFEIDSEPGQGTRIGAWLPKNDKVNRQ
ncbi:MAG: PAS domain S-box protein [Sulfuricella sp.]|nr:PAS domain S-box protein [Sulfuricella sp.]